MQQHQYLLMMELFYQKDTQHGQQRFHGVFVRYGQWQLGLCIQPMVNCFGKRRRWLRLHRVDCVILLQVHVSFWRLKLWGVYITIKQQEDEFQQLCLIFLFLCVLVCISCLSLQLYLIFIGLGIWKSGFLIRPFFLFYQMLNTYQAYVTIFHFSVFRISMFSSVVTIHLQSSLLFLQYPNKLFYIGFLIDFAVKSPAISFDI